ncbi:MAG TPA: gamma-glutamyl-gamma-aminobutyrate hydrolase family protein, partial [Acidobacteriaceae bacterium]|nr:gamma-glutamyl-gamma-aminobutyrate hydrolase family protein [Acidobacteriaceae bacterium]
MMLSAPRIAIPEPTSTDEAYNQRSLPQYIRAVEAAGGIAVPIPLRGTRAEQESMLASCSGILLPGSPADVDPARYGQEATKECAPRDDAREAMDELLLQNGFVEAKPILGICYGLQSLNVWRRGTLIQDLPHAEGANGPTVDHQPGREVQRAHPVHLTPGSRLSDVVTQVVDDDDPGLFVNSSHHQAIDRPGEALMVAARSPVDGIIEALEGVNPSQFLIAVQWHPERSYESSAASRALFKAFLEAARHW